MPGVPSEASISILRRQRDSAVGWRAGGVSPLIAASHQGANAPPLAKRARSYSISCMVAVLGLDIGGANLKAAHTDGTALCRAFPLWRTPDRLASELQRLLADLPAHDVLAVTMTGELCDCFATRAEGVAAILHSVEA